MHAKTDAKKASKNHGFGLPFWPHFGSLLALCSILFRYRILHAFLDAFFRFLVENGRQITPKDVGGDPPFGAQDRSKKASVPQPRFIMNLALILGAILVIF